MGTKLTFSDRLKLCLAGTASIPIPQRTAKLKIVRRERTWLLSIRTKLKQSGQPKICIKYVVFLSDVVAVLETPRRVKKCWYWRESKKYWYIGRKLRRRKLDQVKRGIVFVREDAPVLMLSNQSGPNAVLAGELDDVQESYGPPKDCRC